MCGSIRASDVHRARMLYLKYWYYGVDMRCVAIRLVEELIGSSVSLLLAAIDMGDSVAPHRVIATYDHILPTTL